MRKLLQKVLFLLLMGAAALPAVGQPYLIDGSARQRILASIEQGDTRAQELYARLMRNADKVMPLENPTITTKGVTPPSGDKHDYISLARYWWPNPDTPDGLPYVRRDGESNPELKKYDRDCMSTFASRLSILTGAYLLSENPNYGRKIASILRTWFLDKKTKMNPNANYAQMVPGRNNGMGNPTGVLDTYSLIHAVDAALIMEEAGYLSKKECMALREWFRAYVEWLTTSPNGIGEYEAKNNHGVAYDVQTTHFALYTGNEELVARLIGGFAERRLKPQIMEDGSQPLELARTTAFGYSVYNLTHLLDMCYLGRHYGIDLYPAANHAIDRAIQFLIPYLGNQSSFPYKQIKNWSKVEQDFAQQLLRAYNLCKNEEYLALYKRYRSPEEQKNAQFILFNEY